MAASDMIKVMDSKCDWPDTDANCAEVGAVMLAIADGGFCGRGSALIRNLSIRSKVDEGATKSILICAIKRGVVNAETLMFYPERIDTTLPIPCVFPSFHWNRNFTDIYRQDPVDHFQEDELEADLLDRSQVANAKTEKQRYIARERSRVSPRKRYLVMTRDRRRCVICGRSAADDVVLHIDHIVPLAKGGTSDLDNLQVLCQDCNTGKGVL